MKGVKFYLEYPNKTEKDKATRKMVGNHRGTVVAVIGDYDLYSGCFWGAGSVCDYPNGQVATTKVGFEYLREKCKRISEEMAREIHPALFEWLDS